MSGSELSEKMLADSLSEFLDAVDADVGEFVRAIDDNVEETILQEHNLVLGDGETPVTRVGEIPAALVRSILRNEFSNLKNLYIEYVEAIDGCYTTELINGTLYVHTTETPDSEGDEPATSEPVTISQRQGTHL